MSAPFKAYRNGDNPDYDFFKSTPANTHMRTTSNRKAFVVAPSRLGAMTGISAAGCKPLDEERTKMMTLADWAQRYGQPGAKSRFKCCLSRLTPDNRLHGGCLTLFGEQMSGGKMSQAVFARKGGGTNQMVAAKYLASGGREK